MGDDMWYLWCGIGYHPWRKGRGNYDRSKGRTGKHPRIWWNKKGGGSSSRDWGDCWSDGGSETMQKVGKGTECFIAYCVKLGISGRIRQCVN